MTPDSQKQQGGSRNEQYQAAYEKEPCAPDYKRIKPFKHKQETEQDCKD